MWREFVELAEKRDEPFAALCARFGVSRKTGYKWLNRFRAEGESGLVEQSRRPKTSPRKTPDEVVDLVLQLRREHPDWSTARLVQELKEREITPCPAVSTVDLILRRQREAAAAQVQALGAEAMRFEPNYRWQVSCGPEVKLADGQSRRSWWVRDETTDFYLGVALLPAEARSEAETFVESLLQRHGLPWRLAWPVNADEFSPSRVHTAFTARVMSAGVAVEFVRPSPEALAEEQRQRDLSARMAALPAFQRPIAERALAADPLTRLGKELAGQDFATALARLEAHREQHNFGGRQEALQRRAPISLYRSSARFLPAELPAPVYAPEAEVRLVSEKGIFTFQRRLIHVGRAFAGHCVELKMTPHADRYVVFFGGQLLGLADISSVPMDDTTSVPLVAAD